MKYSFSTVVLVTVVVFFCSAGLTAGWAADSSTLNVYAGAGLKKPLDVLIEKFQQKQNVQISPNYASSGELYAQIVNNQPCDIFFSADWKFIDKLQQRGQIVESKKFLTETVVVAVSKTGKDKVKSFEDLKKKDIALVITDKKAPAGSYAIKALSSLGIWETLLVNNTIKATPATNNQVAAMVQKDEADAGFIFSSIAGMYGLDIAMTMGPELTGEIIFALGVIKGGNEQVARDFLSFLVDHADEFTKYGWQLYK
jgi:molybdate transport system substrate-binding protein